LSRGRHASCNSQNQPGFAWPDRGSGRDRPAELRLDLRRRSVDSRSALPWPLGRADCSRRVVLCQIRFQGYFSSFGNFNYSDVVVLWSGSGKVAHIFDHVADDCLWAIVVSDAGPDRFDHAFNPKLVSRGIERFGHSVGVKEETIAALDRHIVIVSHS